MNNSCSCGRNISRRSGSYLGLSEAISYRTEYENRQDEIKELRVKIRQIKKNNPGIFRSNVQSESKFERISCPGASNFNKCRLKKKVMRNGDVIITEIREIAEKKKPKSKPKDKSKSKPKTKSAALKSTKSTSKRQKNQSTRKQSEKNIAIKTPSFEKLYGGK
jgi:hypothetical protein